MRQGFDNEKYLSMQSAHILERITVEDVADAEWDEDWDGDSIGLTLEGLSKGASQVIVWLYGNDQLLDSQTFMVYVDTVE